MSYSLPQAVLDVLKILESNVFFRISPDTINNSEYEVISDYELSQTLAFEQKLPNGYKIWRDILDNEKEKFYSDNSININEGRNEIEKRLLEIQEKKFSSMGITYRKKKLLKKTTIRDDVMHTAFSELFDDFKAICLQRLSLGIISNSIYEKVLNAYLRGYWPCGWHGDLLIGKVVVLEFFDEEK